MLCKIGSFNMKKLSLNTLTNKKDIDKIVEIIANERFDIVAMQEVFRREPVEIIIHKLGSLNWKMAFEVSRDGKEGYAFIWNNNVLNKTQTLDNNNQIRTFEPRIVNQYRKFGGEELRRPPFYGRFMPSPNTGAPFYELRLINTHIHFGDDTKLNHTIRRNEFFILANGLYPKIEDRVYSKNQSIDGTRVAYTIILGDYNLCLEKRWENGIPHINEGPYLTYESIEIQNPHKPTASKQINTFQSGLTSLRKKGTEELSGTYRHNYDHFSYNIKRFDTGNEPLKSYKVDAVNTYFQGDFDKYFDQVSDHIPIALEFSLNGKG